MRLGLAIAFMLATAAQAQPPRSAIDWLSQSLKEPPNFVINPPGRTGHPLNGTITTLPLDMVSRDAAGLLPPEITGFPRNLWGDTPVSEIIPLMQAVRPEALPEIAALYRQVLLAQSDPPQNSASHGQLLLARIDLLFRMGALDAAETLILQAGIDGPEIFRRWFEISLIGQRTNAPCTALRARPTLSSDVATRVICLARSGDWNAAALTVSLAETLGEVMVKDGDLLVRFLDPEMFSGLPDAGNPDPLDPITFTLRESLALPRPDGPLPLPYLNADMDIRTPARQRILAAERLVRANTAPPTLLFAAYRGARAASSGGAWGRAEAVQALDAALVSDNDERMYNALRDALEVFFGTGLYFAFTVEYADALAHYPPGPETALLAPELRRLLLLAGRPVAVWAGLGRPDDKKTLFATQLASNTPVVEISSKETPTNHAIHAAFTDIPPTRSDLPELLKKIENGNIGEVILRALSLLASGKNGDPAEVQAGLFLLRKLGLEDAARRAAIQLLLIPRGPT
ncbi:MAG: hypothetical protein L3J37_04750 [Rhodobacteraceae bacterium]|nr:hypothetical protein [Paracoccaceae bacterium]